MRKILIFTILLSVFGASLVFADDGVDRDKAPYNPVLDYLRETSRTDPEIIPKEIKIKKDEILNELFTRTYISCMDNHLNCTFEDVKKELTDSVASILVEETFYKILRYGDFSVSLEQMAENLKNKAISAMNIKVVGHEIKEISEILARNIIKTMTATDIHGEAFTPEEYKDFLSLFNNSCGIGVLIKKHKDGAEIVSVQVGGAEKAGLKNGDIITEIDGIAVKGLSMYKISLLLKGSMNTKVTLLVKRVTEFSVEVVRLPVKSVNFQKYGQLGYIKITLFTDNVANDFENALIELLDKGVDSLIVDLRGNPGGSVEETVKILNYFTDKGTLFCLRFGEYIDKVFVSSNKSLFGGKIIILINGNSASASEIIAGALQCRGAKIAGEKSYGKGTIQQLFTFPENNIISAIKFTAGHYEIFNPVEKKYFPVDKIGIEPDIKINPDLPLEEILAVPEVQEWLK